MHVYSTLIPTDVSMSLSFRLSLGLFFVALLFAGCGEPQESSDLGSWTLDTESLTLTEEMKTSGTENYFFGDIGNLAVTPDGRLIVADTDAQHLKVLRPDGTLIDSVGRAGQGPGEFQSVGSVQVGPNDSLYVGDSRANRLSIFAPGSPYGFDRVLSSNESGVSQYLPLGNQYAGMVGGGFDPRSDERPPPNVWRMVGPDGTVGDTLFTARRRYRMMGKVNGGLVVGTVPYTRRTIVTNGPDNRIYYAWTDSLHIKALTPEGGSEVMASIPAPPVPIRSAERDTALAQFDGSGLRSKMSSAMPDIKPALTGMLVADDGRIWVERPTQEVNPDSTTWWRLLPEEETIQEVRVPAAVSLQEVQDGKAYGVTKTELGAPAVVRYRIEQSP